MNRVYLPDVPWQLGIPSGWGDIYIKAIDASCFDVHLPHIVSYLAESVYATALKYLISALK